MVLSDHLQSIHTTVKHRRFLLPPVRQTRAHKGPLTRAEVRCCMSRAPVSASGPGERPSDEAGRSSWVAAADSSASQMH